jgi:hypothetical protein
MRRLSQLSVITFVASLSASHLSVAKAEHSKILLKVESAAGTAESADDDEPPGGGPVERVVAKVQTGKPLWMQFTLTNIYPHEIREDVVVRYYVVRIDKAGQKLTPPPPDGQAADVIAQGQVQMDFKPACRVGARLKFRLREPGVYRVRVETANSKSDHEHFATIDVIAE